MKTSLCHGKLKKWKDDRGFGFIQPIDGSQEIYLHISELRDSTRRPKENDTIYYYKIVDSDGKTRACDAFILGARSKSVSASSPSPGNSASDHTFNAFILVGELLLLLIIPGLGTAHFIWITKNPIPLILYTVMSLLTYALYADDKVRAKRNLWRTSEQTLHLCELAGGWVGGFLAQRILRHKSQKKNYQNLFWSIVTTHHIAWGCWFVFGRSLFK